MVFLHKITINVQLALIVCNALLLLYFSFKTLKLIFIPNLKRNSGFLQALSFAYTMISIFLIGKTISKLKNFGSIQLESVNLAVTSVPDPFVFTFIYLSSIFVFSAFLSNFSRSLFVLNQLDYGVFDNFHDHLNKKWKKLFEFIFRLPCAIFFIYFEFSLSEVEFGNMNLDFKKLGCKAILLYFSLLLWWFFCKWILRINNLKKSYLFLFFFGFLISIFIEHFGEPLKDPVKATHLYLSISPVLFCALAMLIIILHEPLKEIISLIFKYVIKLIEYAIKGLVKIIYIFRSIMYSFIKK